MQILGSNKLSGSYVGAQNRSHELVEGVRNRVGVANSQHVCSHG